MKKASLEMITHYMNACRKNDANFNVNWSIWELRDGAVQKRGLPVQPFWFWWDLRMDLELVRKSGFLPPPPPPHRLRSLQSLRTRTRIRIGLWRRILIESQFLDLGMQTPIGPLPECWVALV